MFHLGVPELILILFIALIIFGPGKLPDVGRAVGKALREFRRASRDLAGEAFLEVDGDAADAKGEEMNKELKGGRM